MKNNFFESFDHLNINVKNLAESKDWYGKIFGFVEVEGGIDQEGMPWAILRNKDSMLCLYQAKKFEDINGSHFSHIGFRINDRAAWEEKISEHKIKVFYGGAYRYRHSYSWYIEDPSGYEIDVALWDDNKISFV